MRQKYSLDIDIPSGIEAKIDNNVLKLSKSGAEVSRNIRIMKSKAKVHENKVIFDCAKANKKDIANIKSNIAHIKNMINSFDNEYVYKMEMCNVHFPMTAKVEGNKLIVNNFLGEKKKREAVIVSGVEVTI